MIFESSSVEETNKIAGNIAEQILEAVSSKRAVIIALIGELGAGKTTFAKSFAARLGVKDNVISPTFILMRQYHLPNSNKIFHHLDLYRLDEERDFNQLGLEEIFDNPNNIILIEWAEKIMNQLPENTLKITLEKISENKRKITHI